MAVKGVDISEHNGNVDFSALRNAGVEFVIIRCGYGSDYPGQQDTQLESNVRKAEAAGMPWGVYLYSYAQNTDMAKSEAAHTLRLLAGRTPAYGVWYDVEDPCQAGADLVSICETYCKTVEEAGYRCGIYSMLSWIAGKLDSPRLDKYDKWVAQWNSACEYTKPYGIWQYTDKLAIGGKTFDGNWAYKDYPALTGKEKGSGHMTKEEVLKIIAEHEADKAKKAASKWAETALSFCREKELLVGDKDGSMRPQAVITRQEVAQVLYSLMGGGREAHAYAKEAWEKAAAAGVLDGAGPREPLTREQLAAVLDRLGLLDLRRQNTAAPEA